MVEDCGGLLQQITININATTQITTPPGVTIRELVAATLPEKNYLPYLVLQNNKYASFNTRLTEPSHITTLDKFNDAVKRTYLNTAVLILAHICHQLYSDKTFRVLHSIYEGVYCEFLIAKTQATDFISILQAHFQDYIEKDLPITPQLLGTFEAQHHFRQTNQIDTAELLKFAGQNYVILYQLEGHSYWLPAPVAPRTGLINKFDIQPYEQGLVLHCPPVDASQNLPYLRNQGKLYAIFNEFVEWGNILDLNTIPDINNRIMADQISEVIKIAEALQEKKIAYIADEIARQNKPIVFIAGPSASGKTTFAEKLAVQLKVLGFNVHTLSLDNYYKDRHELEAEQGPDIDFDTLDALDLQLLITDFERLAQGQSITPPVYDFHAGQKTKSNITLPNTPHTIYLIEGIHGLNPRLTRTLAPSVQIKLYVSALTHLNFDNTNRIPTHDSRLLRRIVRDVQFRHYQAASTIELWKKVTAAEKKYIFAYQDHADIMFNSALVYEIGALKYHAEKALRTIPFTHPSYPEAQRLLDFLGYFLPVNDAEIPSTSIIREFIGKSSF